MVAASVVLSHVIAGAITFAALFAMNWAWNRTLRRYYTDKPKLALAFGPTEEPNSSSSKSRLRKGEFLCIDKPLREFDGSVLGNTTYVRLRVQNVGDKIAKTVKGVLVEVEEKHPTDDRWVHSSYTDPIPLCWSYQSASGPGTELAQAKSKGIDLLQEAYDFLDIFVVYESSMELERLKQHGPFAKLKTIFSPPKYDELVRHGGTYRLTIRVYAEECESATIQLVLDWKSAESNIKVWDDRFGGKNHVQVDIPSVYNGPDKRADLQNIRRIL